MHQLTTPMATHWPLHGASDHIQLTDVLNCLIAGMTYTETSTRTGVARETVANIGKWYQSLWMQG